MLTQVIEGRESNVLTIEFMIGNLCNYKCWYCAPANHEGTHPYPDVDLLIKNITHLVEVYKNQGKNKFEIYLIGGEPTLWKDLSTFCKFLKNNYNTVIRMSTNGYRKPEWWRENAQLFDAVEISVHNEFVKADHIIEVCDVLYEENTNLVANILMDPLNFSKCEDLVEKLKTSKHDWPIIAKVVHHGDKTDYDDYQKKYVETSLKRWPNLVWWHNLKYHEEFKTWVIEDNEKKQVPDNYLRLQDKNRFKNWKCNLGLDHLHIDMNGDISGACGQFLFGQHFYYNLYEENFYLDFNPILGPVSCTKDVCICGFEINISKIIDFTNVDSKKIIPIHAATE
jgi:molybdenum cofactor biosynthesis enzyme MoaA